MGKLNISNVWSKERKKNDEERGVTVETIEMVADSSKEERKNYR